MLRGHGDALVVPRFAEGGGEEAEIAGVYVIGADGTPCRVGLATGNEFSDHRFERRNYLNLAGSKLRSSAIGPELALAPAFDAVPGEVWIERRRRRAIWTRAVASGEAEMSHSLRNIEHHHFKFDAHRRPGDVHVHFFGAHSLSFGEGITLEDGDVVVHPLRRLRPAAAQHVRVEPAGDRPVDVRPAGVTSRYAKNSLSRSSSGPVVCRASPLAPAQASRRRRCSAIRRKPIEARIRD